MDRLQELITVAYGGLIELFTMDSFGDEIFSLGGVDWQKSANVFVGRKPRIRILDLTRTVKVK